ncbi:Peptide N-acetyl-beta-D-glucosaminyl asparaginase amidase A domain containing protein [Hyaloscypha variabilis]
MISVFAFAVFMLSNGFGVASPAAEIASTEGSARTTPPLEVFEVQAPLRKSYEDTSCQQVLVQHDFASSYGTPYVGTYSPPNDCEFTTTIFNLSVTSAGINYDRLGLLFFGDIEIWRTSTAMPVRTGIFWNFQKDMTIWDTLLRSEQKVIMELDNLNNSVFTGAYNVTIKALYYNDHVAINPADQIYPISAQLSSKNQSSVLSLPDQNATLTYTFPTNMERAVVSILASGNGAEEFWYKHVPTEYTNTFSNTLRPYSPFREVQLLIDDQLAGVSWPFPIIFTGGISPGLWVPIVGIDTYDVPSFEIDVTPFLPLLCDGNLHTFELKVVGHDSKTTFGTIAENWYVTASIFIWLDKSSDETWGSVIESSTLPPTFHLTSHITTSSGTNTSLYLELIASRTLSHTSTITTSSGLRTITWTQSLTYTNTQTYTAQGLNSTLSHHTSFTTTFSGTSPIFAPITNTHTYPLTLTLSSHPSLDPQTTNSSLTTTLSRAKFVASIPILSYLTSPSLSPVHKILNTSQNGSSLYFWNDTYYESAGPIDPARGSNGGMEQWFEFSGGGEEGVGFGRHVRALGGYEPRLVVDERWGVGLGDG